MSTIDINNKPIEVKQLSHDWALYLMSQGVIVRLNISRWRATAKLTPEMLGLTFNNDESFDATQKYMNLGCQKLLPPQVLSNITIIETRARHILDNYSFDTVWGSFVPYTAFESWERDNEENRKAFMEQAMILGNRYDEIVAMVKSEYRMIAGDVWNRLYHNNSPTPSFIEDFVLKVQEKIPSREDIFNSFKYNATYFVIPMPSFIEDNLAKAQQIKIQSEMAQYESDLEKQTKKRISEEYILKKKELIDGFLESTVLSMREYVSELCDAVLMSMNKNVNGRIGTGHTNRLKAMIKKVKLLNFYDDKEISKLLLELDMELDKIKGETSKEAVVDKLKKIVETGKKEFIPSFNTAIGSIEI
jgi:hypothetical protein